MKCTETVFDKRSNKERPCNKEIYGMTGLQELMNYHKHLRSRHQKYVDVMRANEMRAESGQ